MYAFILYTAILSIVSFVSKFVITSAGIDFKRVEDKDTISDLKSTGVY